MKRVWQPDGLNVVLLGPDGAGKSSVIAALGSKLIGPFSRSVCHGFAPSLLQHLRQGNRSTSEPHALPARSFLTSLIRAAFWFVYYTFGYVMRHLALARSTLVLNDRHFVDILVDPKRYRYGGPLWLLRLIWRVIPRPDLVVLLDASPEVLQARKQEVSFAETARQRRAYLSLVRSMGNGHVVDATQSLDQVTRDVSDIILRHLAMRIARRFGPQPDAPCRIYPSTFAEISHAGMPVANEKQKLSGT
jgi:thymidylate kinase